MSSEEKARELVVKAFDCLSALKTLGHHDQLLVRKVLESEIAAAMREAAIDAEQPWHEAVKAIYPSLLAISDEPPIEKLRFIIKEREREARQYHAVDDHGLFKYPIGPCPSCHDELAIWFEQFKGHSTRIAKLKHESTGIARCRERKETPS